MDVRGKSWSMDIRETDLDVIRMQVVGPGLLCDMTWIGLKC